MPKKVAFSEGQTLKSLGGLCCKPREPRAYPTPRLAREQLSAELSDVRDALAAEAAARVDLNSRLDAARQEASDAKRELDAARAVSGDSHRNNACSGPWHFTSINRAPGQYVGCGRV